MTGPTKFSESNALLAALDEDGAEVERILAELLPGERAKLFQACDMLMGRITESWIRTGVETVSNPEERTETP